MCTRRSWRCPAVWAGPWWCGSGGMRPGRLWRRRFVAPGWRARADGCRLRRRGAAGLGNPAGAGALGVHEHTGGDGGAVSCGSVSRASRPRGAPRGASGRCPPPRPTPPLGRGARWRRRLAGRPRRAGASGARRPAAPWRARHALPRPALRGQGTGPRRALAVAAGPRAGAGCRRETPAPGPRPPPAGPADAAGHG